MSFNIKDIRKDFPILKKKVYDRKLVYLDSAASAQKPSCVIDSMKKFQEEEYSNVHRGIHYLSNLATDQYELSRAKVKNFINAKFREEIRSLKKLIFDKELDKVYNKGKSFD